MPDERDTARTGRGRLRSHPRLASGAMNLHLIVPDLLWPQDREPADRAARHDAIELLLARGRRAARPAAGLEQWLLERFGAGCAGDCPAAPYSLAADDHDPGEAWWLRADPVHLEVDRDTLWIADSATFDVSRDEADALVAGLNARFAPDIAFAAVRPDRWYARVARPPAIATSPIADVRGRSVQDFLPRGADAMHWHAVLNEVQMLLHEHPVNEAREARGAASINSIWLWGGGRRTALARKPYACVWADDPVARGLARAAGTRHAHLPRAAAALLDVAGDAGVAAVVLDALRGAAAYGDERAWHDALGVLERDWFAPLLHALRAGRIGMITLHALGMTRTLEAETTRQDLRFLWRRAKPLAAYA
ncbi:MAG: phosphoglycerate mutase [Burkholderiales bacterium]|nr:phosphoglycerate mutase [Burkholderiales bacterium]